MLVGLRNTIFPKRLMTCRIAVPSLRATKFQITNRTYNTPQSHDFFWECRCRTKPRTLFTPRTQNKAIARWVLNEILYICLSVGFVRRDFNLGAARTRSCLNKLFMACVLIYPNRNAQTKLTKERLYRHPDCLPSAAVCLEGKSHESRNIEIQRDT